MGSLSGYKQENPATKCTDPIYDRPERVGTWWIIDSINLASVRESWEIVVRSGLSWKDNERKEEVKA
jgi:hypothetical protein